jgi:hypothetical protein
VFQSFWENDLEFAKENRLELLGGHEGCNGVNMPDGRR